jgi:hypothetical protein
VRSIPLTEFATRSWTSALISRRAVIAVNRKIPEIPIDKSISIAKVANPGIAEPVLRKYQK